MLTIGIIIILLLLGIIIDMEVISNGIARHLEAINNKLDEIVNRK